MTHETHLTDDEIDAVIERGASVPPPRGVSAAHYDAASDELVLAYADGTNLRVPRRLLYELDTASPDDLAEIEIEGPGTVLWWPRLEVGHAVSALERGLYGPPSWLRSLGITDARIAPPEAA